MGDSPCLARTCRMACVLMALLVVLSQQLTPAHAAPSAPAPEAPPATASPNLFDSIFPHLAAPAAARHSVSIRSAGEEAPSPESATEALSPRSHRGLPLQAALGTLCSSMVFLSCLWAACSCHLPVVGAAAVQRQGLPLSSHKVLGTLKHALLPSDHHRTGHAAGAASACTLTTSTSPAVLRRTSATSTTAPLAVNQPPCGCSAAPSPPPSAPA